MIIALDLATTTGFCTPDTSGAIKLKGNKHSELYHFLWDLNACYDVEVIAVERTAGQHKNALIVMSRLRGVVNLFAERNDIKVVDYSAGTIKKSFTGNGRASKEDMVAEFKKRTGRDPVSDDEADAYALFELASKEQFPREKFHILSCN